MSSRSATCRCSRPARSSSRVRPAVLNLQRSSPAVSSKLSMSSADDVKERIRSLLDIAEVIGETVVLKPAGGSRLKGLCPFHNEKTPSFHVNQERGFYYCFGCQARGDVFDFVMQTEGLGFFDALVRLGNRVGVEVEARPAAGNRSSDLYRVNELAQEYFVSQLTGPALDYLLGRGLSRESIEQFGLGFAPEGWDGLLRFAAGRQVSQDALIEAGLIVENERGSRYDRFRGRVIFPIHDTPGRIVGFAGRLLGEGQPKYLNTPETAIFHKGRLLYGLNRARGALRDSGAAIVVEGYMDVIALHQTGFPNAVATLGTALTSDHADLLARQDVRHLYLAFDGDAAGERATLSGLDQSIGRNFLVRLVRVPEGRDPADAVLGGSTEEFRAALREGLSEVEFRFRTTLSKHDPTTDRGRQAILNELLPAMRPRGVIDPVAQELRRLVVFELDINEAALQAMLDSRDRGRINEVQARGLRRSNDRTRSLELEIIALLLQDPEGLRHRLRRLRGALPELEDSVLKEFLEQAAAHPDEPDRLLELFSQRDDGAVIFERLLASDDGNGPRFDLDIQIEKALSRLRELVLAASGEQRRRELQARFEEVGRIIARGELPAEELQAYYRELDELGSLLTARDAERRLRSQTR